jgi:hypothetical protein
MHMRGFLRRVLRRSSWGTSVAWHPCGSSFTPPLLHTHSRAIMMLPTRAIARPRTCSRLLSPISTYGRRHLTNNGFFRVSEEVREAIHSKKPVVALETTIYTHGGTLL